MPSREALKAGASLPRKVAVFASNLRTASSRTRTSAVSATCSPSTRALMDSSDRFPSSARSCAWRPTRSASVSWLCCLCKLSCTSCASRGWPWVCCACWSCCCSCWIRWPTTSTALACCSTRSTSALPTSSARRDSKRAARLSTVREKACGTPCASEAEGDTARLGEDAIEAAPSSTSSARRRASTRWSHRLSSSCMLEAWVCAKSSNSERVALAPTSSRRPASLWFIASACASAVSIRLARA
mmetsp:Transcript_51989/g.145951  ORF Transcript_51989/g.145951 Transcript_51989/m.145951 type:complete len:243 (+) Transcript_51989:554-1282(+)